MDEIAGALAALGALAFVAFLISVQARNRQAHRQLLLERQKLVLDKLGSGSAFAELLATDNGARMLAQLADLDKPRVQQSIAATITIGSVVTCAGVGLLASAGLLGPLWDSDYWFLVALGLLAIGVGVGLLFAAAVTYGLSRKWGLIKD